MKRLLPALAILALLNPARAEEKGGATKCPASKHIGEMTWEELEACRNPPSWWQRIDWQEMWLTALCSRVPSDRYVIDNWTPAVARRVIDWTPVGVSVVFKFFQNLILTSQGIFLGAEARSGTPGEALA